MCSVDNQADSLRKRETKQGRRTRIAAAKKASRDSKKGAPAAPLRSESQPQRPFCRESNTSNTLRSLLAGDSEKTQKGFDRQRKVIGAR